MKRRALIFATAALAVILCACGKKPADGTGNVTPANSTEVTQGAASPTISQTATPTVTPDPEKMSLEELIARNRELHEAVSPKVTVHPLGTAPLPSGQEKQDLAYGITRAGSAAVTSVDMETGEEFSFDSNWDYSQSFYLHIDGLKDAKMQKLVNERLESVARDMHDGGFLPSAAGIMPYIKAWGLPKGAVHEYVEYNGKGILSVLVDRYWYWEEERTFADDSAFQEFCDNLDWPYGFNSEITDGYWFIWNSSVKLRYSLSESFYLNINLATGEDLALSDVFPEGYDYLSKLNKEIDRDYDYWFFHDNPDSSDWQLYDPTQEYDGGSAKNAIAGDEMFYLTPDFLYVETKWGDRVSFGWSSDRIAAKSTGESVYSDTSILRVGPAETVEFAGYTWRVKDHDKIGSFTVEQGGSKHAVSVYSDRDYLQLIGGDSENAFFEAAVKLFTDEAIVAFAKQAFERGLLYCGSASVCDIMLKDVDVYGNGCYLTHWRTDAVGADADDVVNEDAYVWIWDGECHNSVDLLDTPYTDLMTDIILTLYWEDSEGSQSVVADREEAEDLVKALMYFTHGSGGSQETPITHITWQNYTFRLGEDGEVCIEPDFLSADSPWQELSVLEPYLPAPLWEKLDGALHRYRKLKCSDPFVITKQLRMYEGYSFE